MVLAHCLWLRLIVVTNSSMPTCISRGCSNKANAQYTMAEYSALSVPMGPKPFGPYFEIIVSTIETPKPHPLLLRWQMPGFFRCNIPLRYRMQSKSLYISHSSPDAAVFSVRSRYSWSVAKTRRFLLPRVDHDLKSAMFQIQCHNVSRKDAWSA